MRIGIFGGSFDPPHLGHLITAEHVRESLRLDRVLFVPAAVPPHKRREMTPPTQRVEMVRLATAGNPAFEVSDIEVRRGGVSFTVDTLKDLRTERPSDELFLLIGMDNLVEFKTWKEPGLVARMAHLVVMTRPGFAIPGDAARWREQITLCDVPEIEIASREIRARVHKQLSVRYLTPPAVEEYIQLRGLYR